MGLQKLIDIYGISIWWSKRRSCLAALEKARTTGMEARAGFGKVKRSARKLEFLLIQRR
jgi:hypothetical protein